MIRTRDFLLYVTLLAFCIMGIAFTIKTEQGGGLESALNYLDPDFVASNDEATEAGLFEGINRDANIAALREKLSSGAGIISQGEPVLVSVDDVGMDESDIYVDDTSDIPSSARTVTYCNQQIDTTAHKQRLAEATSRTWQVEGGQRSLIISSVETITVGSSTKEEITTTPLIALPLQPLRTLSANCLDGDVIGVALDGTLITNSDTWRFRSAAPETLIGYARDGLPIYGAVIDESLLDSCGGYDTGQGYRYHLRGQELFMIACYAAPPQPFI